MWRPESEIRERVKAILATKGLTLHQVSERSRGLYGRTSPHFIPHNLYYGVSSGNIKPSLQQLFTFSKISGYSFHDWFRVFDVHLEEIPRLQVRLPSKRTVLIDSAVGDIEAWTPWFRNRSENLSIPPVSPISKLLVPAAPVRVRFLKSAHEADFVFAKVGEEDAFAFPALVPGSIVRARAYPTQESCFKEIRLKPETLFLVEHGGGYCCCGVELVGKNHITLVGPQMSEPSKELQLRRDIRIVGVLDLEIRPLFKSAQREAGSTSSWPSFDMLSPPKTLGRLLRLRRISAGLSFREASSASREVAEELGSKEYFAAAGSLSDYETMNTPPRHVQKVVTLCILYQIPFSDFVKNAGLDVGEAGKEPIPDTLLSRQSFGSYRERENIATETKATGFLEQLMRHLGYIPLFLGRSLSELSGLKSVSLNDFFWLGEEINPRHPLFGSGILAIVNRHKKKPIYWPSRPWWQQPVYLLLKRDGIYFATCCGLERGALVFREYCGNQWHRTVLANRQDAEVIGQIVTLARRL